MTSKYVIKNDAEFVALANELRADLQRYAAAQATPEPKPEPVRYDDAEVRTMARRCARDGTVPPAEFLAKLDARQARIFKNACPKHHGKKGKRT